ncbi:antiviral reverse transcriptase Drt3a [Leucobacter aridicollis]|uniref:antiviral reverse transcriptase Drt3a n=1 Tax=Leucobacter aridicollis TaxID=283878 RepID=UPI0021031EE3|nr:antiviral reverse transcriptase Drt3a [Leucobacter aridicollis]UTX53754.1 RNA-directed DNA polymerase [Leucobacter aridicollis]
MPLALGSPARLAALDQFRSDRKELRQNRDTALEEALQEALGQFEQALESDSFTFDLVPAVKLGDRQTYRISDKLDIAFPAKQAAAVIRDLRPAESQSRNGIVRALKEALGKKYAHAIYRLDITSFFGSIPHADLLERLRSLKRLDTVTATLVSRLLDEFAALTGSRVGIPQGVGLSSHLADLYLHAFDRQMKATPGVLFYARYVDDMVLVLEDETVLDLVRNEIDDELQKLGLKKNLAKTDTITATDNGDYPAGSALEYLGYRFTRAQGILATSLTANRHQRRMKRLELALQSWLDSSPDAAKPNYGHDGMLIDRLRYLAGNTKLLNSKDNVAIGLFFSNSALDADARELTDLDAVLEQFRQDHAQEMSEGLTKKMKAISFVGMFAQKPFYRFSQRKIQRVIQAWEEGN